MSAKPFARLSAVMAVAAMLAGTAFVSATPLAAAPDKQTDTNDPRSRRVCRTVMPSGSRLTTRICRTQAEWEEARSKTQQGVLDHQMKETTLLEQAPGPR